jgi:hypothetical protein
MDERAGSPRFLTQQCRTFFHGAMSMILYCFTALDIVTVKWKIIFKSLLSPQLLFNECQVLKIEKA